jgi:hypothetical protein
LHFAPPTRDYITPRLRHPANYSSAVRAILKPLATIASELPNGHAPGSRGTDNKLGLYRQCVGARIGGGMRRNMFADALLIQPVVLSRGTVMPTMGIECSGAVGGGCGWWYSQGLACLPGLLEVDGRVNRGRRTPLKRDSGVAETHE